MRIKFSPISKSDRVIFGIASAAIKDVDNELITEDALREAFKSYINRGQILFHHKNIPVGEVLPSFTGQDGKEYVSEVAGGRLDIVARIYNDTEAANQVWQGIEDGELRSFSIGGSVLDDPEQVCENEDCSKFHNRINRIDLHEISVVGEPANPAATFQIIKSTVKKPSFDAIVSRLDGVTSRIESLPDSHEKLSLLRDVAAVWKTASETKSHLNAATSAAVKSKEVADQVLRKSASSEVPSGKRTIAPEHAALLGDRPFRQWHKVPPLYEADRTPATVVWGGSGRSGTEESLESRMEAIRKGQEESRSSDALIAEIEREEAERKAAPFTPPRFNETDFDRRQRLMAEAWKLDTNESDRAFSRTLIEPVDASPSRESHSEFVSRVRRIQESGFERNG